MQLCDYSTLHSLRFDMLYDLITKIFNNNIPVQYSLFATLDLSYPEIHKGLFNDHKETTLQVSSFVSKFKKTGFNF